jgi:hypothetical protein
MKRTTLSQHERQAERAHIASIKRVMKHDASVSAVTPADTHARPALQTNAHALNRPHDIRCVAQRRGSSPQHSSPAGNSDPDLRASGAKKGSFPIPVSDGR